MKIIYFSTAILFMLIVNGCSTKEQSSYDNNSAQWQKYQSEKALENLEKE